MHSEICRAMCRPQHTQVWQSSWNWSCTGLISIILTVFSTATLQFQGQLFPFPWVQLSELCKIEQLMSWLGFWYLQGSSKDMDQNIYSTWGGTQGSLTLLKGCCCCCSVHGFPRQEYCWVCNFLLQSLALAGRYFTAETPGKPSLNETFFPTILSWAKCLRNETTTSQS